MVSCKMAFVATRFVLAIIMAACLCPVVAWGCVGARPLAMGGAYIGLADDISATYWNPAGLVQLDKPQATVMYTGSNRDSINYQDYYAMGTGNRRLGWAISKISYKLDLGGGIDKQTWWWGSLGFKITGSTALGVNVRKITDSFSNVSTDMAIDAAFFQNFGPKFSAGLLVQNINEPETTVTPGGSATWVRNTRPGIAFRPDKTLVLTADLYDAENNADSRKMRYGLEKILLNGIAIRAGYYGNTDSFTFGLGGKIGRTKLDAVVMTGDLDNTVLISATGDY